VPAGNVFIESGAAGGQLRANRRVTISSRASSGAVRRLRAGYRMAVGKADIGIGPRGKRVFILSDFKPVVELQRHQARRLEVPSK